MSGWLPWDPIRARRAKHEGEGEGESMDRARRRLRGFPAAVDGAAAVEFALILPAVMLTLSGLVDAARLISLSIAAEGAAQAGAAYARAHAWDAAAVAAAVSQATDAPLAADPPPRRFLACVADGELVETPAGPCPDGSAPGDYVAIAARTGFTPMLPWPQVVMPDGVSAETVARLR